MTRLQRANNISDLRLMARKRLPRPIFDYIDGGADDEVSLRRNADAFADYELIPDVLNDVSDIRTETSIFGQPSRWPLMLSPTCGLWHAAARRVRSSTISTAVPTTKCRCVATPMPSRTMN